MENKSTPKIAEKIALSAYLAVRGKALTRVEAQAFGGPYPLQAGWPVKYGAAWLSVDVLATLRAQLAGVSSVAAGRAVRAIDVATAAHVCPRSAQVPRAAPKFPGFMLRGGHASALPGTAGRLPWE